MEIIRRETLCAALASIFTVTVVIPSVLIFGDRSLPFQYVDVNIPEKVVAPGQRAHVRYTINKVRKDCHGSVSTYFYDSAGNAFFLGESPTIYFRALRDRDSGVFERSWTVPDEAMPGEGVRVAYPTFWCNGVQWLNPIHAPPQTSRVMVTLRPPTVHELR